MIRSFDGKTPRIAESAFVSEAAYVVGDVEIGEECGVWPGAVIRADFGAVKIGRNTDIEDNVVLHAWSSLEIGDNVVVGHSAMIHGTRIGNDVLIGIGAALLPGAEVGNECIIAAGAVVTEGMKVPDRSFVVGVPAEIRGEVSEEQLRRWTKGHAESYVPLARRFKEQGL